MLQHGSTARPHGSHSGSRSRVTVLFFGRGVLFFMTLPLRIRPGITHRFLDDFPIRPSLKAARSASGRTLSNEQSHS